MIRYGIEGLKRPPQTESFLASKTHEILMEKLVEYRNDLYYKHTMSLCELCIAYELMTMGVLNGWHVFPMPVGGDKTLSIRALCQALSELPELHRKGQADSSYEDVSILVCASKVEALCQLKRDLVEDGVPEEWIGLYHSYQYNEEMAQSFLKGDRPSLKEKYASEPAKGDYDNRRILLTTHQRVSGKRGAEQYRLYKGNQRSMVIYDESLIRAKAKVVKTARVDAGVSYYEHEAYTKRLSKKVMGAVEYLVQAREIIDRELKAQIEEKRKPKYVQLPQRFMEDIKEYKETLRGQYKLGDKYKELHDLLDMSQERLRILQTSQGTGLITYDLRIDPELRNMIILDASYPIRDLVKEYDSDIKPLSESLEFLIKPTEYEVDYSNLNLFRIPINSGRSTMNKEFSKPVAERLISSEISYIINKIPDDEGILIFTYKHRPGEPDFEEILKNDLERHGVKTDAEIEEVETRVGHMETVKRINFLTWGQETSLNEYAWVKNQIQVGILHRDELDIGGTIIGQKGDLLMLLKPEQIKEMRKNEVIICFYQALGRTHCRIVTNGKAGEANVWYTDVDTNIWETLQERGMLKNSKCEEWPLQYMDKKEQKANELGLRIMEYLNARPVFEKTISIRKLKEHMELSDIPSSTVQRAINFAVEKHEAWKKVHRSLVRT